MNLNQVTLPVSNIEASASFYERMGFKKIVSDVNYVRFECPEGDSTFSLEKIDKLSGQSGAVIYFEVDDLNSVFDSLLEKGFKFESGPTDEEWLWSEAKLKDPSGNIICLYSAGVNRKYPPWRINS